MKKLFLPVLAALGMFLSIAAAVVLTPGESGKLTCLGQELSLNRTAITEAVYSCLAEAVPTSTPMDGGPAPTATPLPTATAIPTPTATVMVHDHQDMAWHAPGSHGNRPTHEHGDAPPAWVTAAGYLPTYDHVGGTPNENHAFYKHTAFKGWAGRFSNVDWYGVFHLDFNPGGHGNRFHSYQLWLRDTTGAVSHLSGWLDFGQDNQTGPNLRVVCGVADNTRPIVMVNQVGCTPLFETWYARAAGSGDFAPDFGFSIGPNYFAGGDPLNPDTWTSVNGGAYNNRNRRIEFAWYANRSTLRGDFYTTQWGDPVSGPTDPLCGTQRAYGDKSYTVVCLKQTIAPTLTSIQFPGNAVQRTFPGPSVLPN